MDYINVLTGFLAHPLLHHLLELTLLPIQLGTQIQALPIT
jgi:hypothetical protein